MSICSYFMEANSSKQWNRESYESTTTATLPPPAVGKVDPATALPLTKNWEPLASQQCLKQHIQPIVTCTIQYHLIRL